MSAFEALQKARATGLRIVIDRDDLVLESHVPPPADVLDLLTLHKAAIVSLLCPGPDGWSGEDWRVYFDGALSKFEKDLQSDLAEARAFAVCVSEWLCRNPVRSPAGRCAFCSESPGLLLPYLTGYAVHDPGHTWLHQECSLSWHLERRARALQALVELGLVLPIKYTDDFGKNGGA
jgi:hypothetical protein